MCGLGAVLSIAQGSYVGAMIGQIWGGEIYGQLPVQAESGRLSRHAGCWLVSLVKARGPPASYSGDALVHSGLFLLLCVRMSTTQHTRSIAIARHPHWDVL